MKITNGKNILILRENGTYMEIPDGRNISKNIPIDALYAFINVSMNELPAYIMIPIDNLVTHIYKCAVDYSLALSDLTAIFGWNYSFENSLGVPISNKYHIEIETVSDLYSFLNTFDTLSMVTECGYYGSEIYYEVTFNEFKMKLRSDRYNFSFDIYDNIEDILDEYSSSAVGLIMCIVNIMHLNRNSMCYKAQGSDEYKKCSKSFILKTNKSKYNEVVLSRDSNNIDILSTMKDSHCLLYRVTYSYVGDLYVAINQYEYMVLNNLKDIAIQIVPSVSNLRFKDGRIFGEGWDDFLPYEDQLEYLKEIHEDELDQPYLGLNGMESGVANVEILYQFAAIIRMCLSVYYCNNSPTHHFVDNTALLSEMGLHIVYITFTFKDGREYMERVVLFEEDYKLSYRYIFTKLLREAL